MKHTNRDNKGYYIVIPEAEDDNVVLTKQDNQYVYVIRGEAVDKLGKYEDHELCNG